jgi:hypothetical protein
MASDQLERLRGLVRLDWPLEVQLLVETLSGGAGPAGGAVAGVAA